MAPSDRFRDVPLSVGSEDPESPESGSPEGGNLHETLPYEHARRPEGLPTVRRFRLTVVEGPGLGTVWESASDVCSIGSHPLNDLPLDDSTVSRFHCEVRIGPRGPLVKDLDSTNGVIV